MSISSDSLLEGRTGVFSFVLVSGQQALVRALLLRAAADRRAGLSTEGLVSGDRGSLGIRENLAPMRLWGPARGLSVDGVFDLWCGKALGLDRSMNALRHATGDGIAPAGGAVAMVGDAPSAVSATIHSRCTGRLARGAEMHPCRLLASRAFYEVARLRARDPLFAPDRTLCGRALRPRRVDLSEGLAGLAFRAIEAHGADLVRLTGTLEPRTLVVARRVIDWPSLIRGYGPVREESGVKAEAERPAASAWMEHRSAAAPAPRQIAA